MISIIVPIYNAESHLEKCIQSVINQSISNFELILVDDGSTDKSKIICQRFLNDNRVRYYYKTNGGVSSARNFGIKKSSGNWLCFIDADDWVESDYLKNIISKNNADLVISNIKSINEKGVKFNSLHSKSEMRTESFFVPDDFFDGNQFILSNSPVAKTFKTDIIINNNIYFNEHLKNGEDFIFVLQYALKCKTIEFNNQFNYCYNKMNNQSVTNSYFKDYFTNLKNTKNALFEVISNYRIVSDEEKSQHYFRIAIKAIYEESKNDKIGFFSKYSEIKKIINSEEVKSFRKLKLKNQFNDSKFFRILEILVQFNQPLLITFFLTVYNKIKNA